MIWRGTMHTRIVRQRTPLKFRIVAPLRNVSRTASNLMPTRILQANAPWFCVSPTNQKFVKHFDNKLSSFLFLFWQNYFVWRQPSFYVFQWEQSRNVIICQIFFSSFVLFLCCDDSPADRIVSRKRDFPWRITRNLSIISFHSLVGLIVNLFTTNMDRNGRLWYMQ